MAQLQYNMTASDIKSNIDILEETATDLEDQIHKQEEQHYNYIEHNEKHISDIEKQLSKIEHLLTESNKDIRRNSICIKILIGGLFCAGISVLALIYHILTM